MENKIVESGLRLKEFVGQRCDVIIIEGDNDIVVRFEHKNEHDYPVLSLSELKILVEKCEIVKQIMY